jgi:Arc/MetJ family transcription regulator
MRTNVEIDDDLMREAMRATGERTKRAVVVRGLRLLVQTRGQSRIRRLRGTVTWRGDLDNTRCTRAAASR